MPGLLNLQPDELHQLRTPGGREFAAFVGDLLYAEAARSRLGIAAVRTYLRTDAPDGGADAAVDLADPGSPCGWFEVPTAWQFRAQRHTEIREKTLRAEVQKRYASELIRKGYGYRFCICDGLPPSKVSEWEQVLASEVTQLAPDPARPRVVTLEQLCEWASHYPGLLLRHLNLSQLGAFQHLEAWGGSITRETPTYVPIERWQEIEAKIEAHLSFQDDCHDPIFTIEGEAGVGKTRLVYEVIRRRPDATALVLYAQDEAAIVRLASHLSNMAAHAILVADECSLQTRADLRAILDGFSDRVRVLALDNTGRLLPQRQNEAWLTRIEDVELAEILRLNFVGVSAELQRAVVGLAGGFVRLAAELCRPSGRHRADGSGVQIPRSIHNLFSLRLPGEDGRAVAALALLPRVGRAGEVASELDQLAGWVGLDRRDLERRAMALRDAPGFVASSGRYLYITPQIIAQVAFAQAWREWAAPDPQAFLERLPESFLSRFLQHAAQLGDEEVRRCVGAHFRSWLMTLQPTDLQSAAVAHRLRLLGQTRPDPYLAMIDALIGGASGEELRGERTPDRGKSRRELVWLAEPLVVFPEFYPAAERILWRLALAENEPGIVNNASGIWSRLFRIYLSGTSEPFLERLRLLESRLSEPSPAAQELAFQAFERNLDATGCAIQGPALVMGRVPPPQWQPASEVECVECVQALMAMLTSLLCGSEPHLRSLARTTVRKRLVTLARWGWIDVIGCAFPPGSVGDDELAELLHDGELALSQLRERGSPDAQGADRAVRLEAWLAAHRPASLSGRLRGLIGRHLWDYSHNAALQAEVRAITQELLAQPDVLTAELSWLCSTSALGAVWLGREVGSLDPKAAWLDPIVAATEQTEETGLARGYVVALLHHWPGRSPEVNAALDAIEVRNPLLAYHLFAAGSEHTRPLERTLALVDVGALQPELLVPFGYGIGSRELTGAEWTSVLRRLVPAAERGETRAHDGVFDVLAGLGPESGWPDWLQQDQEAVKLLVRLLSLPVLLSHDLSCWWKHALEAVLRADLERGLALAFAQWGGRCFRKQEAVTNALIHVAASEPEAVVRHLGRMLLDPDQVWQARNSDLSGIVSALPFRLLAGWLDRAGLAGARALAQQLPRPYLGEGNRPLLPPITELVLQRFGSDDEVQQQFCLGPCEVEIFSGEASIRSAGKAALAEAFLSYPLPAAQRWASRAAAQHRADEQWWRQHEAEALIPTY